MTMQSLLIKQIKMEKNEKKTFKEHTFYELFWLFLILKLIIKCQYKYN